ncbi:hypothetical protein ECANGB1_1065 [Enterospora canceri]|uniref:Uncharacterized protein n=1 Tax=Enterospora canceri TaxID=1081671 RepID=A0A1Y1S6X4_9MICR|nr:hypothetical protein ECANGB1_1065 [Enterospora canceri]
MKVGNDELRKAREKKNELKTDLATTEASLKDAKTKNATVTANIDALKKEIAGLQTEINQNLADLQKQLEPLANFQVEKTRLQAKYEKIAVGFTPEELNEKEVEAIRLKEFEKDATLLTTQIDEM